MPYVTSKEMLLNAQAGHYAVGAFNVENMEMVRAVIRAAEELKAPVMLQTTPGTIRYGTSAMYAAMARAEAQAASVPVCLHLDHGSSYELACECLKNGYSSVMIDGSKLGYEDNIVLAKKVVSEAAGYGIPVEAELGKVGGKEDDLVVKDADTNTDPAQARDYADRTGIDSLAVAIGTAHGFYVGIPVLDVDRLSEIRKVVSIPLVLHGASGLTSEQVEECVRRGICKVNFATELRKAYTDAEKALYAQSPDTFDPKKFGTAGMEAVTELVKGRMKVCGCAGKA